MDEKYGCETLALLHWEQLHATSLPEEVKSFYLATNGFEFTWKFRLAGADYVLINHSFVECDHVTIPFNFALFPRLDHNYPVGKMHINGTVFISFKCNYFVIIIIINNPLKLHINTFKF